MTLLRRICATTLPCLLAASACNDEKGQGAQGSTDGAVEEMSIVVEADKSRILEEEQSLAQKKETMQAEQERLERERKEVSERLASLSKKDRSQRDKLEADQKRLQDEETRLRQRMSSFEEERDKLEKEKNKLLDKISKLEGPKGAASVTQREEFMARREKDVAKREADLAKREKDVADREAEVARSLKDAAQLLSSLGSAPRTVVVAAPSGASGSSASAATVQSLRKTIARKMDQKGLLMEDLPPTARELDEQARTATKSKEFGDASDALTRLDQTVDGMAINRQFIDGKMMRVNRAFSGKKLEGARQEQLTKLLSEFNDAANDGRWDRANQKINQMLSVYQGK